MEQLVAQLGVGVVEDGFISADDLGINRGDGCFDATLVRVGDGLPTVDFLDDHLARLANSAKLLGMEEPVAQDWRDLTSLALGEWGRRSGPEAVCKFVLTRGQETVRGPSLGFITITELNAARIAARQAATAVTLSSGRTADALNDAPWLLGGAKTLSYGTNLAYIRHAHDLGVSDAVLVSTDGFVLEAPQSGILVLKDGVLSTTPVLSTGILDSITVRHAMAGWQALGRPEEHKLYRVEDLHDADALWLTSSIRGITPMVMLDGHALPVLPEVTEELRALVQPKL